MEEKTMKVTKYNLEMDECRRNQLVAEETFDCPIEQMKEPLQIYALMANTVRLDSQSEEHLYMISSDAKGHPLGIFEISHGTITASISSPREIFCRLLLTNACGFMLAHNHPSGDPTPSDDDVKLTKKIAAAGALMGTPLMDHVIIGNGSYYSFREHDDAT